MIGDFNTIFNKDEAKNRYYSNQERRVADCVGDLMNINNLADSWAGKPIGTTFTWRRPNTDCFSTIDRIIFPKLLLKLESIESDWSYGFSDHAAVKACFNKLGTKPISRSRITRLDPSLAKSNIYGPLIEHEYGKMMAEMPEHWNPHQKLEFAKVCIRTVSEKIQSDRKKKEAVEEELLNNELDISVKKLATGSARNEHRLIEHIEELRARKAVLIEEKGVRLAEKLSTKWYNEGEKSTKYFMRLLNRPSPDQFGEMEKEDGTVLTESSEIEEEIVDFYKKLYEERKPTSNQDATFFDQVEAISDDDDKEASDVITCEALKETLSSCQDTAPGPDGIPYSYLTLLWTSYGNIVLS